MWLRSLSNENWMQTHRHWEKKTTWGWRQKIKWCSYKSRNHTKKRHGKLLSRASWGDTILPTPWFQASWFQNSENHWVEMCCSNYENKYNPHVAGSHSYDFHPLGAHWTHCPASPMSTFSPETVSSHPPGVYTRPPPSQSPGWADLPLDGACSLKFIKAGSIPHALSLSNLIQSPTSFTYP